MNMLIEWLKARLRELSTWLGLILGAAVTGAQVFGAMKPELAYLGFGASVLLAVFKEKPGA